MRIPVEPWPAADEKQLSVPLDAQASAVRWKWTQVALTPYDDSDVQSAALERKR